MNFRTAVAAAVCLCLIALPLRGQTTKPAAATTRAVKPPPPPPDFPAPRLDHDGNTSQMFLNMHELFLKRGKSGPIGPLFIGDSITYGFQNCKELWANYAPLKVANFGIGGDCTQHILWRIDHGELDGITPKVVILLIGTNNISGHNTPDSILAAEVKIVDEIHAKLPQSKLLVLGIFPRAQPYEKSVVMVNAGLAKLDDGNMTRYLDLGPKLLPEKFAQDAVHLNPDGYQVWQDTMEPLLTEMLK